MYINIETKEQVILNQIIQATGTSLSSNPTDETLAALGYARIINTPRPDGDVVTQGDPEERDGVWYQTWSVREFTEEEIEDQRQAAIPESVPALNGLLALDNAGLSSDYEAWATDPARTFAERAFIDKAMNWRRADPVIASAAEALELSDDDIDELFISADQIAA